jgi:hypothetical protein
MYQSLGYADISPEA